MIRKYFTIVVVGCALSCAVPLESPAEPDATEVWVAVRVLEKGAIEPAGEYYAILDKKVFEETLQRTMPSGFLKLSHVAWMEGGHIRRLTHPTEGPDYGYSDVMYIRVENVLRIIPLDEKFVKEWLLQSK